MQRVMNVALAVFGMLLIVALVIEGADIYRAAQRGPKWKRRLIAAALVLLGAIGLTTAQKAQAQSPPARPSAGAPALTPTTTTAPADKDELTKTREWLAIVDAWHFAGPLATSGKSTMAQRKEADQKLAQAEAATQRLLKSGAIETFEADLLLAEAQRIKQQVYREPPTDQMVTCYEAVWVRPTMDSLARLQMRLPRLEAMLRTGKVRPEVLGKVLPAIEADLEMLGNAQQIKKDQLGEADQAKVKEVRARVATSLAQLRAKLPPQSDVLVPATRPAAATISAPSDKNELTKTKEWLSIVDAWYFTAPLAQSGKSTVAQRREMAGKLEMACKNAQVLADRKMLEPSEAQLLIVEAETLGGEALRSPPTDEMVTCYKVRMISPAQKSLERLDKRLPLLVKLAQGDRIHPSAIGKVLPTIEADLATLERKDSTPALSQAEQDKAAKLTARTKETLAQIRTLLDRNRDQP